MKKINNNTKDLKQNLEKNAKSHLKMSNKFNEIIGKLIRDKRKELNLSPVNIAKYLNINYHTYSKYETGKITIPVKNLFSIAKLFDVSIDEWLDVYFELMSFNKPIDSFDDLEFNKKKRETVSNDKKALDNLLNKQYANSLIEKYPDSLIEKRINILKEIYKTGDKKLIRFLDDFLDYLNFIIESQRK